MMRRIMVIAIVLVATLAVMAEDVVFLNNRRQWEKLPTTTLARMASEFKQIRNMPDSATLCCSILAERALSTNLTGKELELCIGALCNLGSIYQSSYCNFSKAFSYLLQAEDLAIKRHQEQLLSHIYINLAGLYSAESLFNASKPREELILPTLKQAFYDAVKHQQWTAVIGSYLSMISTSFEKECLDDIEHELDTFAKLGIPDTVLGFEYAKCLSHGIRQWYSNEKEEAFQTFHALDSCEIFPSTSDLAKSVSIITHTIFTEAYLKMDQDDEALRQIKEVEHLSLTFNYPDWLVIAYQYYIKFYTRKGDKTRADIYRLKRYELQDSFIRVSHVNDINSVRFLHEIDKMNEEQQALALKQRHDRQMLWVVSIAALMAIVMLVLLYLSRKRIQQGYRTIYQQNVELLAADEVRRQSTEAELAPVVKYSHNQMDDDVMDELWMQIVHFMQTSDEIYQDSFNVDRLCDIIVAKREYVSQTINSKTGDSFNALLNDYRIREACRRMNDTAQYGQYTVEGIAHSVGYSRSYFVRIFKEATGIPPSAYMKLAKAGNNDLYQPSIPVTSVP